MPNYSTNIIAFKGEESKMREMINDALANSGADKCATFAEAIRSLEDNAKHKDLWNGEVALKDGLTLRTFLPTPDTFLLYDTTNHPEAFPAQAKMQKDKYGAVGWYDYNVKSLGTKWDSDLRVESSLEDGVATVYFHCETAWSMPMAWMESLSEKYGVRAFIIAQEEGGFYYLYGEVNGITVDILPAAKVIRDKYLPGDSESDWDYDGYYRECDRLWENSVSDFYDMVKWSKVG